MSIHAPAYYIAIYTTPLSPIFPLVKKPVSRTTSLPPQPAPPPVSRRSRRSRTLTHGIIPEIIISFHETENQHSTHEQGSDESHADFPDPPSDSLLGELSLDRIAVPTVQDQKTPPQSRPLSPSTCDIASKAQLPKSLSISNRYQFESESRQRATSDKYPSTQPSKEDDTFQTPQRHSSWSESTTIHISVNTSPTLSVRSKSCEKMQSIPKTSTQQFARVTHQSQATKESKGHLPLTTSYSVPGNMAYQEKSSTEEHVIMHEDASDVELDSGGLTMSEDVFVQPHVKVIRKEKWGQGKLFRTHWHYYYDYTYTDSTSQISYAGSTSPKQVSKLKRLGQKISLPLKSGRGTRKVSERNTHCTWTVKRESVLHSIWNHKCLDYTQCSEQIPIDIECEHLNPYLFLFLYPYGLFSDKNKSMTLLVKLFIPNDCPPVPVTASFNMSWKISTDITDEGILESSKKPIKVSFEKGMVYIHKFLPHSVLQQHCCKMLKISVQLSTSYSVHDIDSYSNDITDEGTAKYSQMTQKCSGMSYTTTVCSLILCSWLPDSHYISTCALIYTWTSTKL